MWIKTRGKFCINNKKKKKSTLLKKLNVKKFKKNHEPKFVK